MTTPDPFAPGYRLTDGNQLNDRMANPQWSVSDPVSATVGGTLNTSTKITFAVTNVATVAAAGAGLTLPQALPGKIFIVVNNGVNDARIFADGGSTINGIAGVVGALLPKNIAGLFTAVATNQWQLLNLSPGAFINNVPPGDVLGQPITGTTGPAQFIPMSNITATATGSTTARSLANRFADAYNVKDYGAKGDGVTDDLAAIQACVFATPVGGTIYFPSGTYLISNYIYCNVSRNFIGEDPLTCVIQAKSGSTFTGEMIHYDFGAGGFIENLGFDPGPASVFPYSIIGFADQPRNTVRNCRLLNNRYIAIALGSGSYGVVEDCYIQGTPIQTLNQAINVTAGDNCIIHNNEISGAGMNLNGGKHIITNNHIYSYKYGGGIVLQNVPESVGHVIANNVIHSDYTTMDSDFTVQSGMELYCRNSIISNNVVYNCADTGIQICGQNCIVISNECYDNNQYVNVNPVWNSPAITIRSIDATYNAGSSIISNNCCFNTNATFGTQKYGIADAGAGIFSNAIFVSNNNLDGNALGPVSFTSNLINYTGMTFYGTTTGPISVAANSSITFSFSVRSATIGDLVSISYSGNQSGIIFNGYVSATDIVTVVATNTTGSTVNLPSGTYLAQCQKNIISPSP